MNLIYTVILCTAKRKRKKRMKGGGNEGRKERQRGERKKKEGNRERESERKPNTNMLACKVGHNAFLLLHMFILYLLEKLV